MICIIHGWNIYKHMKKVAERYGGIAMKSYAEELYIDEYMDIIEDYKILLGYGISPEDSYKHIEEYYYNEDYAGTEDEKIYWIILAEFQAMNGIQMEMVRNKAISYLDSTDGISKEEAILFPKIKQTILNPREKRKFRKPPTDLRAKTKFKKGDIISLKLNLRGYRWGGDSDDIKKRNSFNNSRDYLSGKKVYYRVVEIDKVPVSKILPELDYCTMPIMEMLDVVNDDVDGFNMDDKYSRKPLVTNIYIDPPKTWDFFVLMSYTKKELQMFGEIELVGNVDCDSVFTAKDNAVYIDVSNLILDAIWTFMDKF